MWADVCMCEREEKEKERDVFESKGWMHQQHAPNYNYIRHCEKTTNKFAYMKKYV